MSLTTRLQMLRHPAIAGLDNGGYLERESMMEGVAMSRDRRHEVAGPPGVVCPPGVARRIPPARSARRSEKENSSLAPFDQAVPIGRT